MHHSPSRTVFDNGSAGKNEKNGLLMRDLGRRASGGWTRSTARDKLSDVYANVLRNLPEKGRRDILALVERNGGHPAVRMTELLVRTLLANLYEIETNKKRHDLPWFENREVAQVRLLSGSGFRQTPLEVSVHRPREAYSPLPRDFFEVRPSLRPVNEHPANRARTQHRVLFRYPFRRLP